MDGGVPSRKLLDILKNNLDTLFKEKLCRPGPEDPRELPSDMKLAGGVLEGFKGYGGGTGAFVNSNSATTTTSNSGGSSVGSKASAAPASGSTPAAKPPEEEAPNPEDFHRRKLRSILKT